jgi:transcriptional regulator with XRE-family HTH domain
MSEQLRRILSECIKKRRKSIGLSQEAFADLCGLHRTYIGGIERGERNITLETLERIAGALNAKPHELLDPEQNS